MEIKFNEEMDLAIQYVQSQLPRLGNLQALDEFMDDKEEPEPGEELDPTEVTLSIPDMDSAVAVLGKFIGKRTKLLSDPHLYHDVVPQLYSCALFFGVMVEALAKGESLTFVETTGDEDGCKALL